MHIKFLSGNLYDTDRCPWRPRRRWGDLCSVGRLWKR